MPFYDDPFSESYTGAQNGAEEPTVRPPGIPDDWEWDPKQGTYVPRASVIGAPVQPDDPLPPTPQTPTTPVDPVPSPAPTPAPGPAPMPGPSTDPPIQAAPGGDGIGIPSYTPPPAYKPPPAFAYDPFAAPDPNDLLNDPAYQFELNQGLQAIGAKNAALGTLNTGGTIKAFQGYGQNLASTRYNDLFNRKLTEYGTNRNNALDTYNTNYGTQYKDPWSINYQSQYTDPFAMNLDRAQLGQNNSQFNASLGVNQRQFNTNQDWQRYLQNYKQTTLDPFDMKYKLLGLL